ncbi:YpeB-like protein with putative protease inhibitory function [Stella humosa]|uniref:YpeB-like protein with putative protease inhibitory function n=1 Tax=Stella humosa TaxID=94 RepID=A0A3N1MD34_9PROT|nr:PepSY domain-containing protein [Stella humosa]ROQ01623.1 YpeB-like protein with putative protease inhibitory function [Stella humosa]
MTRPYVRVPLLVGAAALAAMLSWPTAAPLAGDDPSPEQRTRIEAVLQQMGFTSWGDIEREDDGRVWEVDDARGADGRKYDLKLSGTDLRELSRKLDD